MEHNANLDNQYMFMVITNDEFKIPAYVADSYEELMKFINMKKCHLKAAISKEWAILNKKYRILKMLKE